MRIRWKLILVFLIVLLAINSLFTIYMLREERRQQEQRLQVKIETFNKLFLQTSIGPLWDIDIEKLKDNLNTFFKDPEIVAIHLLDVTGSIDIDLTSEESTSPLGKRIVERLPLEKDHYKLGELSVSYTTALVEKRLLERRQEMILLTLGLIFLASTAIFLISIPILKPISEIISALIKVDEGDLDSRLILGTKDEFKEIEGYFNKMVETIKEEIEIRKKKEKESKKSESRYKSIFQFVGVSIWEEDLAELTEAIDQLRKQGISDLRPYLEENPDILDGLIKKIKILDINDETLRLFKAPDKDTLLQNWEWTLTPESMEIFKEAVLQHADGAEEFERETEYQTLEGDRLEVIFRVSFPKGEHEEDRALVSMMDITERKEIEHRLLQMHKMDTIGTLAGGIAHDFNNILCSVIGAVSLLKLNTESTVADLPKIKENIQAIELAANRAADLVQQLLALSRQREFTMVAVDLNTCLENVIAMCRNSFVKEIEISVSFAEQKALTYGDAVLLEQVLMNIFINAMHAMTKMRKPGEPQGGTITATIEPIYSNIHFSESHPGAHEGNYWLIRISDTGVGMDKQTVTRVFEPFFSKKDKHLGTGLGLALAYNTVRDHHGFIDIYSEPGTGTSINVFLPATTTIETAGEDEESVNIRQVGAGRLVLVIEDEELIRNTVQRFLEECGFEVIVAGDGAEGLRLFNLRHSEIRITLLDMVMPVKCGDDTFREMKKINPEAKIILMSGFKQDPRIQQVLALGANSFVQKPFAMGNLVRTIEQVLSK